MRVVYVIVANKMDGLLQQALVSMYSLKLHNPQSEIIIVTDDSSCDIILENAKGISRLIHEIKRVDSPSGLNNMQKSRYLKTSLRKHIEGDFLYLDCDTIVLKQVDVIAQMTTADIGAVKHSHHEDVMLNSLNNYLKITGKQYWGSKIHYNSGVLYVKDTDNSYMFFEEWHKKWLSDLRTYNVSLDQLALSQTENRYPAIISELNGEFNCQIETKNGRNYMFNPYILHYYSKIDEKSCFPLKTQSILDSIRENGMTENIIAIIRNPQLFYFKQWKLFEDKESGFYNKIIKTAKRFYQLINKLH